MWNHILIDCTMFDFGLFGGDLKQESANGHMDCRRQCDKMAACRSWSYSVSNLYHGESGDCIMTNKSSIQMFPSSLYFNPFATSGFKNSTMVECSKKGFDVV